ncbi:MAG: polysaccharide deacetylase family protein, partial [Deltaproteobacteria bacterium]|nr:polysaccharide deacetylase family protein [Deltaproteobacteria bacterium]
MSPFQTSTILLALAGLSAWLSLEGDIRWVAIGSLLGLYLILFSLGICVVRFGFFVRSFCRGRQPGAGVVLTFDDGPDPSGTKGLLEALSRHGVKAAFFPIGMKAEAHPELLREIDQAGHVIGNHSYRHAWFTNLLAGKSLEQEMVKAQKAIEAAIGKTPAFFRPPAGLTNPHYRSVLRRLGLHLVGWDVRVFDTKKKTDAAVESLVSRARHGSILLIHEACRDPESLKEMVDAVIKGIRGRGLAFTDLEQLSGIPAYQEAGEDGEPAALSVTEVWRRSGRDTKKGRLLRFAGMWLASTAAGRKAIREKTDLTAFKERPSTRFLTGVGLILISYVLGWPMVGLFSFLAAYYQNAGLLIGGP